MENKKKKIVLITTIVIILVVICSVGGYTVYKQNEIKERSAEVKAEIVGNWEKFDKEEDRNKKLEIFEAVETDKSEYQKEKDYQKEVVTEFDNILKKMKSFFSEAYDKVISDNTLADIEKISDKAKLTTAKENLEKLLNTIESEKAILKLDKLEEKTSNAQDLITKYGDRIKVIEEEEAKKKAEEEAKKKAEEEARAAEEAKQQQAQQSNSESNNTGSTESSGEYDYSNSGSNSSGSTSNSGSSGGRYVISWDSWTENGVTTYKYYYSDGTVEFVFGDGSRDDITNNGDIYG